MAGLLQNQAAPMQAEDGALALDDPALESAINYMGKKLYSEDLSEEIARVISGSNRAQPKLMAMAALKLAAASDAETDGDIKEENLSILGMMALNEVFSIAEAGGVQVSGADVSSAFQEMVIMFAQEQGLSPEELASLKQAMVQVDDAELAREAEALPDDYGDSLPDEDVPVGDREMGA